VKTVLVVDDEPRIVELARDYLEHAGFGVMTATDGPSALTAVRVRKPDILVLDLGLPGMDGLDVAREIRRDSSLPIIMLTARDDELDRVLGLEIGADDYVTKPFSPRELTARVRTVLRRAGRPGSAETGSLRFGDLRIDGTSRTVESGHRGIQVTAREFDLLFHLAKHPNQVFTRDQLMNAVWDYEFAGDSSTVTVHVRRLRSKIESDPSRPRHLKTVWGVGYKFEP
jgi:two-component system, OmpR family, response regulator ResD